MRKTLILILAAASLLAAGCASMKMTPEEKARQEQAIREDVLSGQFKINVTQMIPRRGPARQVSDYGITVDGDRFISWLPYFGQAWNVPYGGGTGLNFEAHVDYLEINEPKPGEFEIVIQVQNEEDILVYYVEVFQKGGRATINVRSRNREGIAYLGTVDTTAWKRVK